ncbi:hypothetical protein XvhCFBP2543_11750 [Xanthomonas vasicola]|uniref:Uncharacterized protein n=1 Tax=Xanthomonas vasicola TaxID=56459 RepID=A0ABD7SAA1_XANVA|nr:hypothetical protein NX81_018395 [Xanthomonas vasicola]RNK72346.1 hypothetical protein C9390_21310 [Xanthomonas vasicola pv. vasculorum]PPV02399.1 hypothetical protein XvhCFBP2543_11750 [Xanthomonas vasicola]RNL02265.1 hypothetical protein C9407_15275 [Xanthomonas vasicola pv. vasculorum]TWQ30157.1 hypothetical protein FQJ97_05125 [Xanthomonas vasicola]
MLSAARLSRVTATYVCAGHPTPWQHTPSLAQALGDARMRCARRNATRCRLTKNGGGTRLLNSR